MHNEGGRDKLARLSNELAMLLRRGQNVAEIVALRRFVAKLSSHLGGAPIQNIVRKKVFLVPAGNVPLSWAYIAIMAGLTRNLLRIRISDRKPFGDVGRSIWATIVDVFETQESFELRFYGYEDHINRENAMWSDVGLVFGSNSTCEYFAEVYESLHDRDRDIALFGQRISACYVTQTQLSLRLKDFVHQFWMVTGYYQGACSSPSVLILDGGASLDVRNSEVLQKLQLELSNFIIENTSNEEILSICYQHQTAKGLVRAVEGSALTIVNEGTITSFVSGDIDQYYNLRLRYGFVFNVFFVLDAADIRSYSMLRDNYFQTIGVFNSLANTSDSPNVCSSAIMTKSLPDMLNFDFIWEGKDLMKVMCHEAS
jgi:hypothetical protein